MIKKRIFGLEGNSFAGKTSTSEYLKKHFNVPIVREYGPYAYEVGTEFPQFPPESYEQAKKSIDFFVELEKRRSDDAVDLAEHRGVPVVMDRGPFSCIVFEWTVSQNLGSIPSAYLYSIEKFQRAYEDGQIILPDGLVVLEPQTDEEFLRRVEERGRVKAEFLNELRTLHTMQEWYTINISKVYPKSSLFLQTEMGNVDLAAKFIFEFMAGFDDMELRKMGLTPLLK